jgi:hypothetical protein
MNRFQLSLLLLIPLFTSAQKVITLSVHQPPELGFTLSDTKITINKGQSVTLGQGIIISGGSGNYRFSWSPGKYLNDSTLLHPVVQPADTTIYTLTVTDHQGCSFSINYTVNVKDNSVSSELTKGNGTLKAILYPNPGNGEFSLKITGNPARKVEITIANNSGSIQLKKVVTPFSGLATENFRMQLAPGVYLILIRDAKETVSTSFIVR